MHVPITGVTWVRRLRSRPFSIATPFSSRGVAMGSVLPDPGGPPSDDHKAKDGAEDSVPGAWRG